MVLRTEGILFLMAIGQNRRKTYLINMMLITLGHGSRHVAVPRSLLNGMIDVACMFLCI
jgi:hypothetical protein